MRVDIELTLASDPRDHTRCIFERCRFSGVEAIKMHGFKADFDKCYRNDFIAASGTLEGVPLRQFSQNAGAPKARTQTLRNSFIDTAWIQTGPRTNIFGNADPMLRPSR